MARRIIALDSVRLALSKSGERKKNGYGTGSDKGRRKSFVCQAGFLEGFFFQ